MLEFDPATGARRPRPMARTANPTYLASIPSGHTYAANEVSDAMGVGRAPR